MNDNRDAVEGELAMRRIAREVVSRYTDLSEFPQSAQRLVASAREHDAPDDVIARLRELDPAQEFASARALWAALGYEDAERM